MTYFCFYVETFAKGFAQNDPGMMKVGGVQYQSKEDLQILDLEALRLCCTDAGCHMMLLLYSRARSAVESSDRKVKKEVR